MITAGETLTEDCCREYAEEEIAKEAVVFLTDGMEDAAARKRALKKLFYDAMEEFTGRSLPWGNLTGIRPTKLIRGLIKKNDEESCGKGQTLAEQLYDMHRLKGEKLVLGMEIAKLQEGILSKLHGLKGYSVYVGIPFCPSRCLYCSFTSNPVERWKKRIPEYLGALQEGIGICCRFPIF